MPLLVNYGSFWNPSDVFWGKPNNPGRLLGRLESKRRSGRVDFWKQLGIYALHADFRLVYVGQTGRRGLGPRIYDHSRDGLAGRWDAFSWFGIRKVKKDKDLAMIPRSRNTTFETMLNHLEAAIIAVAEPPQNSQSGRFGEEVEYYLQVRDSRLSNPEEDRELLREIAQKVEDIETTLQNHPP